MARRQYTKREKLTAVIAAEMTSTEAAADRAGIPRSTLQYWLEDPEFVALRQKTREDLAEGARVMAFMAMEQIKRRIHEFEPRDLNALFGIMADKMQLLSGEATHRMEHRDITATLDDHERDALADAIDQWLAERPAADPGVPALGAGSEVRQ